jgi:hypothetical protein
MSTPVTLDLDTIQKPAKAPFTITLGGKEYNLTDIREMDYRQLLAIQKSFRDGDVQPAVRAMVSQEDQKEFFANDISADQLKTLFEAYNSHYDIKINANDDAGLTGA